MFEFLDRIAQMAEQMDANAGITRRQLGANAADAVKIGAVAAGVVAATGAVTIPPEARADAASENPLYPYLKPGQRVTAWKQEEITEDGKTFLILKEIPGIWAFQMSYPLHDPNNRIFGVWPDETRDDFLSATVKDEASGEIETYWIQDPRPGENDEKPDAMNLLLEDDHGAWQAPHTTFNFETNITNTTVMNHPRTRYGCCREIRVRPPCANVIYGGFQGGYSGFYRSRFFHSGSLHHHHQGFGRSGFNGGGSF